MLVTYQDSTRREDLIKILKDISPLDGNYLYDNLGMTDASGTLHEWTTRHIDRATSVTHRAEGFEAGEGDPKLGTRSNNITAIVAREVKVSKTELAVATATGKDPFADQKEIALQRLVQDHEYVIVNGSKASGASGTARQTAGIDNMISSHVTARASGTSMSVTEIEDIMEEVWNDVGNGFVGRTLLVTMGIARTTSGFTTNIANYVEETDKLYRNIKTFEGSAGQVKIVPHKDVRNVAGSVTVYLINEEMYKVAYLRKPEWDDQPATGSYVRGMYESEFTVESLAEKASAKRTGYKKEAH